MKSRENLKFGVSVFTLILFVSAMLLVSESHAVSVSNATSWITSCLFGKNETWTGAVSNTYSCSDHNFIEHASKDPVLMRQYVVEMAAASAISAEELDVAMIRLEHYLDQAPPAEQNNR